MPKTFWNCSVYAGDLPEPLDDLLVRLLAHLDRVLDRSLGLAFERRGPAVPEHRLAVGRVEHGRSAAAAGLAGDADRDRHAVGPALGRVMAGRAAHRAVERDARIEIKLAAQLILPLGDRVAAGNVDLGCQRLKPGGNCDGQRLVLDQLGLGGLPEDTRTGSVPVRLTPFDLLLDDVGQLLGVDRAGWRGDALVAILGGEAQIACASGPVLTPPGAWRTGGAAAGIGVSSSLPVQPAASTSPPQTTLPPSDRIHGLIHVLRFHLEIASPHVCSTARRASSPQGQAAVPEIPQADPHANPCGRLASMASTAYAHDCPRWPISSWPASPRRSAAPHRPTHPIALRRTSADRL